MASPTGQRHAGDLRGRDALVMGCCHFVFGRQIHPQLRHLENATFLAESRGVELLVDDAATGCHPLHIARADDAACASRIAVL